MSRRVAKIAILFAIIGGAVVLYFTPFREYLNREHIREFSAALRSVWYGPVLFILGYGIGTLFAIPASLFIIAAGVVFGWKLAVLYTMMGCFLGATLSYYAGRFMGEGLLDRFGRAGLLVRKHVTNASFSSILIARLIPGPPFAIWNYVAGVCHIPFGTFLAATVVAALPGHVVFSYCADALFNGTMTEGDAVRQLLTVAGLFITLVVGTTLLKRYVARAQ
jgi:uncharacterized membrane protein YdjX (TVP38/TMEM64 family)